MPTIAPKAISKFIKWKPLVVGLVLAFAMVNPLTMAKSFAATPSAATGWWQPTAGNIPWQWELNHEINLNSAADMGTNSKTYAGVSAPNPIVYDIDGFNNTTADVTALHSLGKKAICYVEVGAAENYRPDYSQFPASALGNAVLGYPYEKYVNINDSTVVSVIKNRINMCHQKGFDGVEPDIDDSYGFNTGFNLTLQDEVDYLTNLSNYAHSLGMAWGLKNGADSGSPVAFLSAMVPHVDFVVAEGPFDQNTSQYFYPLFNNANKAFFDAEYSSAPNSYCPISIADNMNAVLFSTSLDGSQRITCQ